MLRGWTLELFLVALLVPADLRPHRRARPSARRGARPSITVRRVLWRAAGLAVGVLAIRLEGATGAAAGYPLAAVRRRWRRRVAVAGRLPARARRRRAARWLRAASRAMPTRPAPAATSAPTSAARRRRPRVRRQPLPARARDPGAAHLAAAARARASAPPRAPPSCSPAGWAGGRDRAAGRRRAASASMLRPGSCASIGDGGIPLAASLGLAVLASADDRAPVARVAAGGGTRTGDGPPATGVASCADAPLPVARNALAVAGGLIVVYAGDGGLLARPGHEHLHGLRAARDALAARQDVRAWQEARRTSRPAPPAPGTHGGARSRPRPAARGSPAPRGARDPVRRRGRGHTGRPSAASAPPHGPRHDRRRGHRLLGQPLQGPGALRTSRSPGSARRPGSPATAPRSRRRSARSTACAPETGSCELPYGTLSYRVRAQDRRQRRLVDHQEPRLRQLVLSACHPLYSAASAGSSSPWAEAGLDPAARAGPRGRRPLNGRARGRFLSQADDVDLSPAASPLPLESARAHPRAPRARSGATDPRRAADAARSSAPAARAGARRCADRPESGSRRTRRAGIGAPARRSRGPRQQLEPRPPRAGCREARARPPVAQPAQAGLPGCSAMRQKSRSTPSASSAGLTWSSGPIETPPEVSTTSASRARARTRPASPRRRRGRARRARPRRPAGGSAPRSECSSTRGSARAQRLARRDELVAGREHATRGARWHDRGDAPGGDRRERQRAQAAAGASTRAGRRHVPPPAHEVARRDGALERDRSPLTRALDGHDRIGAVGQRRAGGDSGRRRPAARRIVAGERSAGEREPRARVGVAQGVAVHRRVVEWRQVVRGVHVGGDDPAGERARERERLGRERREALEQQRARLGGGAGAGIGNGQGAML